MLHRSVKYEYRTFYDFHNLCFARRIAKQNCTGTTKVIRYQVSQTFRVDYGFTPFHQCSLRVHLLGTIDGFNVRSVLSNIIDRAQFLRTICSVM